MVAPTGPGVDLDKIQKDVNAHFIVAERLTPADTQLILDQAQKALKTAWNFTFDVSMSPTTWLPDWTTGTFALQSERMQKLGELFQYYQGVLDEGVEENIYREVTSPLVLGRCYGAPSCSDELVGTSPVGTDTYGPYVTQVPKYLDPYILTRTMEVFLSGAQHEWDLFIEDVKARALMVPRFVVDTGLDLLKPILLGVGIVLGVTLIARYAPAKKKPAKEKAA